MAAVREGGRFLFCGRLRGRLGQTAGRGKAACYFTWASRPLAAHGGGSRRRAVPFLRAIPGTAGANRGAREGGLLFHLGFAAVGGSWRRFAKAGDPFSAGDFGDGGGASAGRGRVACYSTRTSQRSSRPLADWAAISHVPGATAVTRPVSSTVATAGSDDDHVTDRSSA